ncbi:LysR substrate-binding domain-containing protein [uncultured Pelagimonas sp.]|uniref:LysR substrate-binding domain-containing protein n=1 Tax=uncultured Pelagimonas sp. TaxID=1618102 RepID=UPI002607FCB9|nr:LysR substrate-binding domain-containing protein [uncultured Pelagimonas sp.]
MSFTSMISQRRFLPSISSLLALEAVSRLGSASAAAKDLSLTQSAVSHQLKQLEAQMGVHLIARDKMKLTLTPAGQEFVQEARLLLERLSQASIKLRANPAGGSLNLSILPAFGLHWLAPRLKDFNHHHPNVSINLQTHKLPFSFDNSSSHAAIHYGKRDWPDVNYLELLPNHVIPVCAPGSMKHPVKTAKGLLAHPLLHLETHPDSWEQWFGHMQHPVSGLKGSLFDQSSTMAQAAVHGLGVALLPTFVAQEEVESGRLVLAFECPPVALGMYYLVWPKAHVQYSPLKHFRDWLESQRPEQSS